MTDFGPLLSNPQWRSSAQPGSSASSACCSWRWQRACSSLTKPLSIGIIGAIYGPTSIFVASNWCHLLAPIAVAAYTYMSLVPIIQPPIMRLLTTKAERRIPHAHSNGP